MTRTTRDFKVTTAMALFVIALAIPYAFMHPGFLREDWWELYRVQHCGPIHCPGNEIAHRTTMVLLYDTMYSVLGNHPLATYLLLVVVTAGAAAALYRLLRLFLPTWQAATAVTLWAAFPTHGSLTHWASAIHINVALLVLLIGLRRAVIEQRESRFSWLTVELLTFSVMAYEAMLAPAFVAWLLIGRKAFKSQESKKLWDNRHFVVGCIAMASVANLTFWEQLQRRSTVWVPPLRLVASDLMMGQPTALFEIIGLIGIAVTLWAIVRLLLHKTNLHNDHPAQLILAGVAIIVLGAAPFLTSDYDSMFLNLGDRANVISAIGAALLWLGVLEMVGRRWPFVVAGAVMLAGICIPARIAQDHAYALVAQHTRTAVAHLEQATPAGVTEVRAIIADDPAYTVANSPRWQEVRSAAAMGRRHLQVVVVTQPGPGVIDLGE